MAKHIGWKERLLPLTKLYETYHEELESRVAKLSGWDLTALMAATKGPTMSNCSWATYWGARDVRDAVAREMNRRRHARTAEGVG